MTADTPNAIAGTCVHRLLAIADLPAPIIRDLMSVCTIHAQTLAIQVQEWGMGNRQYVNSTCYDARHTGELAV